MVETPVRRLAHSVANGSVSAARPGQALMRLLFAKPGPASISPYCYRGELSDAPSDGRPHLADRVAHCGRFDPDHAAISQLHRRGVLDSQWSAGSRIAEVAAPLVPPARRGGVPLVLCL